MEYYLNVGEDNDGWYVAKGHEQIMFGLTEENATEVCSLFKTIEQLQARVAELEAENARLKTVPMKYRRMQFNAELQDENSELRAQLAAAQAEIKRLRDALERADSFIRNGIDLGFIRMPDRDCPDPAHETPRIVAEAIAQPSDTSALDDYVAEKVKEVDWLKRKIDVAPEPCCVLAAESNPRLDTLNEELKLARQGNEFQRQQIATLTRQRDLAVEALEWIDTWAFDQPELRERARMTLATIKESGAAD